MTRPHVLLIHCHDLGRHLQFYGAATVSSPHLDALAGQGVVADRMFATAPQCSPSRASLFTGRWPHNNGVMGLTHGEFAWDLHPQEQHLAAHLGPAGYRTELIGVHHESRAREDRLIAERLGFDRVETGGTGGMADEVAGLAVDALSRLAEDAEPFYLQVGFLEPHRIPGEQDPPGVMGFVGDHIEPDAGLGVEVPAYLRQDDSAREEIAELQGAVRHMDAAVGRVLQALDALGLADDTITIFTTDHGLALPRAKCSLYDPGLEVAFIVRWPGGGWTGGERLDELLSNVDVVPTLLDALGLPAAAGQRPPLHGRSFRTLLDRTGTPPAREEIFGELTYHDYYDPRRCVRTDRYKLIANFSAAPGFMDPCQSWQHRCTPVTASNPCTEYHPPVELYDLRQDPQELADVAGKPEYATVRADLLERLTAWMRRTDDPLLEGAVTSPLHRNTLAVMQSSPR